MESLSSVDLFKQNYYAKFLRKEIPNLKHVDLENLKNCEFFFTSRSKTENSTKNFYFNQFGDRFWSGRKSIVQSSNRKNEIFLGCDPYLGGSINIHKQIQKLNLKTFSLQI